MVGRGWSSVSGILTRGVSGVVVSDAVSVLKLVEDSEGGSEWGGCDEEGIVAGIGSCGIGAGEGVAELFLLRRSCQLFSTGLRRRAVVEVGVRFFGCVGRVVG